MLINTWTMHQFPLLFSLSNEMQDLDKNFYYKSFQNLIYCKVKELGLVTAKGMHSRTQKALEVFLNPLCFMKEPISDFALKVAVTEGLPLLSVNDS